MFQNWVLVHIFSKPNLIRCQTFSVLFYIRGRAYWNQLFYDVLKVKCMVNWECIILYELSIGQDFMVKITERQKVNTLDLTNFNN